VAALLDGSRWSAYQKSVTALVALALIFDGFDIQILGFAIPSLMREWHAARSEFGPVLAVGLAGMVVGGPMAGYCGDGFGRGAALMPNVSALTAEFAPLRRRPAAVKLTLVCVPLGGMLGGLLAAWALPTLGWRGLYGIGGALPLLARQPALWPRLARLLTRTGHVIPVGATFEDRTERESAKRASVSTLFGPGLARETAGLWIAFFFCLGSIYLIFGWLPAMLTANGLDLGMASSGLAEFSGYPFGRCSSPSSGRAGDSLRRTCVCRERVGASDGPDPAAWQPHPADHMSRDQRSFGQRGSDFHVRVGGTCLSHKRASDRSGILGCDWAGRRTAEFTIWLVHDPGRPVTYWRTVAIAMLCAFASLAWVRSHYPAIGKLEKTKARGQELARTGKPLLIGKEKLRGAVNDNMGIEPESSK
jgi:hypothetical protein